MENKFLIIIVTLTFVIIMIFSTSQIILVDYQKQFEKPSDICSKRECEKRLCEPNKVLDLNHIEITCQLIADICKCEVYNYDAFYQGLGNNKDFFNPSANLFKSYDNLLNFVDGEARVNPPVLNANFMEGKMQGYSKGVINVWPSDAYGQYHESVHFLLRHYTLPQDGFYPYLEEGLAHYGAYCYNKPNTKRCNYYFGEYKDPYICVPNTGNCKGQVRDTSLILQLRQDYGCDWEHCWKEFLKWAITEKKGKALNLKDSINKLNELTGKNIRPLLLSYGIDEKNFPEAPPFAIYYEDEVIEEIIINEDGQFTTLA